jgi:two-component system C4-dicarboxylate transport sensor histidine kinase DctB
MKTTHIAQNNEPPPPTFLQAHDLEQISCGLLHDLINPLTGLTLYLETVLPRKHQKVLRPIQSTSTVIRDFIRIVRDALHNTSTPEKVPIGSVATHVIKLFTHKALCASVTLVMAQDSSKATLRGHKIEMYQIFINLISNAIDAFEHVARNSNRIVTVSISSNTHHHTITVTDNGAGIPPHIFKTLFTKYHSSKSLGCGIGLMNTHRIVRAMGGTIKATTSPHQGTQFSITLPH